MEYLDFVLEVGTGSGREYPLHVVSSPAGEARETMHFPLDQLALENRLQKLQIALLRSGGKQRKALSEEELAVRDFGQQLFDALINGEVRSRYDVSCQEAKQQKKGLRLKLRIQAPELATLPWEFVYNSGQAEYVCLSRRTPVLRYLEMPSSPEPLMVAPPLRILGMVASPTDQEALDVDREKGRVEKALEDLRARNLVELIWLPGQTWHDLQDAMAQGPWHVFHFIGHGGFDKNADEGLIVLADDEGLTHKLTATALARFLEDQESLRLVVLNSCEGAKGSALDILSSTAAILVRHSLPAVVAMQYEISDEAAIEFARTFYRFVAEGMPVDAAVAEARKAISVGVANSVEWGTPVLYMRAPDGVLFNIANAAVPLLVPPPSNPEPVPPVPASLPQAKKTGPGETKERHAGGMTGTAVAEDDAVKQCLEAAERGNAVAQNNLGARYEQGHGVDQDYGEAANWYLKAARQGHPSAQYNLGRMYEKGWGVVQSDDEMMTWYRKAASQGNSRAQEKVKELTETAQPPLPPPPPITVTHDDIRAGRWEIGINAYGIIGSTMVVDLFPNGQLSGQQVAMGIVCNLQGQWSYDPRARLFVMQVTANLGGFFNTYTLQIQLTGRDGDVFRGQDMALRQYGMRRIS